MLNNAQYSNAEESWSNARNELSSLEVFDKILILEEKGLITHYDVEAAKNIIFFLSDRLDETFNPYMYSFHVKDVEKGYDYYLKGKISNTVYRKIIRNRLTSLDEILKYYKNNGKDVERDYAGLIELIIMLSDFHQEGVINESEYNTFVNLCFDAHANKCILFDEHKILFGGQRTLHKIFMEKLQEGYKVLSSKVKTNKVKIHMVRFDNSKIKIIKRKAFLDYVIKIK